MDLLVRPAVPADLPAMVAIKHDAGVAAWSHILPPAVIERLPFPERWGAAIVDSDPQVRVLIGEAGGRARGFALTHPSADDDALAGTGELDAFFVDPASWGTGVGRGLLAAAVRALRDAGFRDATLWTAAENQRPRRIYDLAGWRTDGTERRRSFEGVEFVEVRYRIVVARS